MEPMYYIGLDVPNPFAVMEFRDKFTFHRLYEFADVWGRELKFGPVGLISAIIAADAKIRVIFARDSNAFAAHQRSGRNANHLPRAI